MYYMYTYSTSLYDWTVIPSILYSTCAIHTSSLTCVHLVQHGAEVYPSLGPHSWYWLLKDYWKSNEKVLKLWHILYEFILYSYTLIFQNQSEDPTHQLEMHSYFCRNKKKSLQCIHWYKLKIIRFLLTHFTWVGLKVCSISSM